MSTLIIHRFYVVCDMLNYCQLLIYLKSDIKVVNLKFSLAYCYVFSIELNPLSQGVHDAMPLDICTKVTSILPKFFLLADTILC